MKELIQPVDVNLIKSELNELRFARNTNNGGNQIFIIDNENSPNTMKEIGRLRELTFRGAGGGTGEEVDIDEHDTGKTPFKQLVVWDPDNQIILGGYRFIEGKNIHLDTDGQPHSPTSHLFRFTEKFINEYLGRSIELGRSFVQPAYQSTQNARKGIFALDNLWDGLGYLIVENPDITEFFGKITMYLDYDKNSRDAILYFLKTCFPDSEGLLFPHQPLSLHGDETMFKELFNSQDLEENYKILSQFVRNAGVNIPPLVNAYIKLSPTMKTFGTSLNDTFGAVEETGIMIHIPDIYSSKTDRHVSNIDRDFGKFYK